MTQKIKSLKRQFYWIGVMLLCIIFSCGKKKNNLIPIDANLKKKFSYKPGTYWVYQDSLSGQLDSFVIINNTIITVSSNGNYDFETEKMAVYSNGIINDSIACTLNLYEKEVGFQYMSANSLDPINYNTLFEYPFLASGQYSDNSGTFIIDILPSFSINANAFNNVAKINRFGESSGSSGIQLYSDLFYISADVGIVKMKFNHFSVNTIWELKKYNILH